MSQLFTPCGPSIGALASVLPVNIQGWLTLWLTDLILLSKGISRVFFSTTIWRHNSLVLSILYSQTLTFIHDGWKTIVLTIWAFDGKVISLLFNTLSRFVIAFLPRSKCLLISWLQSLSAVILEPKKIKSVTASTFCLFAMKWWDWMPWSLLFECWVQSQLFHSPLSPSSRGSLVSLSFRPIECYHLHIWGCWYLSWQSWFQLALHPAWHVT